MGHFTVYNPPVDDKCMLHPPVVEVYLYYPAINKRVLYGAALRWSVDKVHASYRLFFGSPFALSSTLLSGQVLSSGNLLQGRRRRR